MERFHKATIEFATKVLHLTFVYVVWMEETRRLGLSNRVSADVITIYILPDPARQRMPDQYQRI